jgi:predicted amidohydrolase
MAGRIRVAAVQMPFGPDVAANVATMEAVIRRLARRGVKLAAFPECCLSDYLVAPAERDWAAISAGMAEVGRLARSARMALVYGTAERNGRRRPHNTVLALDARGRVAGRYRKVHLFAWDRPLFTPGKSPPRVIRLAGLRVAMQVCYDLRFPEGARLAALSGAELVTYSLAAATADAWKKPVMEAHLASRAAENGIYALAANRCHRVMMMRSGVYGPDGLRLGLAPAGRAAEVVVEVDPRGADHRHLRDRRADVYSLRRK